MRWEKDLIKDIRTSTTYDNENWGGVEDPTGGYFGIEFTDCNHNALVDRFLKVKDSCKAILEIGVDRSEKASTYSLINNKKLETIYVGIDIEDKSFLDNPEKNIFTIKNSSSNIDENIEKMRSWGVTELDFILIDGWHSINQVLIDWEYTKILSPNGIIAFHDTSTHPGPHYFIKALNKDIWEVEENVCPNDHGIGFAWKKKLEKKEMNCTYKVGDKVKKVGGDYTFEGVVVSVFEKLSGAVRLVVEDDRGVLHVYSEKILAPLE